MTSLRPALDQPVRKLITHLTDFAPPEENFDVCHAYVTSNLLYHTYLDPVEKRVLADYKGLEDKLRMHVLREKADALQDILSRLKTQEAFQNHVQHDVLARNETSCISYDYRILVLLWNLSESPINAEWSKDNDLIHSRIPDKVQRPIINWRAVLAEGEEVWQPGPGSEEELSDWSISEDEDGLNKTASSLGGQRDEFPSPEGEKPHELEVSLTSPSEADAWIRERIQPEYWKSNVDGPPVDGDPKHARFVQRVDAALIRSGLSVTAKTALSEYQLLRECLWMLRNPLTSTVFQVDSESGNVSFVESVCIPSVTPDALSNAFQDFCLLLRHLRVLHDFCDQVYTEQNNLDGSLPYTYEAYASSLSEILALLSSDVLGVEAAVAGQQGTFTALDLLGDLEPWMRKVARLHKCHVSAIEPIDSPLPNWHKAVKLISGLFHSMQNAYDREEYNLTLNLFLKSCAPYFRIIGLWLFEGRLEDFRDEFLIAKKPQYEETELYWKQGFLVQPFQNALEDDDLALPPIFGNNLSKILVCGKSNEILSLLKKRTDIVVEFTADGSRLWHEATLFHRFLASVRNELALDSTDNGSSKAAKSFNHSPVSFTDSEEQDIDPYLQLAFKNVQQYLNDEQQTVSDLPRQSSSSMYVLSDQLDPVLPINAVFERALHPLVQTRYLSSCSALVHLFREKIRLEKHLATVRRVYLLEAGDLMQEFYTDIFERLERRDESLDSSTVTLFLQDCIGRRYPEDSDRFTVTIPEAGAEESRDATEFLQQMALTYRMHWPLNIIINSGSIIKYNKVFLFLLKVKRALWNLQQINAKELVESHSSTEGDNDDGDALAQELPEDETEKLAQTNMKVHRLLLLRSWLFHFIGNVHSYFMTRVLHSTEFELKSKLEECKDLDEILNTHSLYLQQIHDRCFLHKSAAVLLNAITKVLDVCASMRKAVQRGVTAMPLDHLLQIEETYVLSHHFLASTLSSMTQRRNVPHLDGLAAALVYSCPARV